MQRIYTFKIVLFLMSFGILASCSKDEEALYSGRDQEANPDLLEGVWSVYLGELNGVVVDIPENNPECGRDFVLFNANNTVVEFLIRDNYECIPEVNEYSWSLNRGIITLRDSRGQTEELVILELTPTRFVFRAALDYDENGSRELFTFTARRYTPPEDKDLYSYSFVHDNLDGNRDKIRLGWRPYQGIAAFDRYEIYRSDSGCDKSSAILVGSISDRQIDAFIDENPANRQSLCYYFRLYTEKGLLSESELIEVNTDFLEVQPVSLDPLTWDGASLELSWSPFGGYYFSHYEISVRNYTDGTGYGYQQRVLAEISDRETIRYPITEMPYVANPVFSVQVVDIFGNRSQGMFDITSTRQLEYRRPGLLDMEFIRQMIPDPSGNRVILYGRRFGESEANFYLFDYASGIITAESDTPPNTSSEGTMKRIDSEEGPELLIPVGSELRVYNAQTLSYKFSLNPEGVFISDFEYLGNSIWAFTDGDNVSTFNRSGSVLQPIDQAPHFADHQAYSAYYLVSIGDNRVVVGHFNEPYSLTFTIDQAGLIGNRTEIQPVVRSERRRDLLFNTASSQLFGLSERSSYRTSDFLVANNFTGIFQAFGVSKDGQAVFGSDNDPLRASEEEAPYLREAAVFNLANGFKETIPTQGYPLYIFENQTGQRICLSSYFRRARTDDYTPSPDFFFEVLE